MAHPFLDRLAQGPVICDGAMGTMLHAAGISFEECFEALNLTNPELVASIHRAYIEAGAEIIETNTYGANRLKLEQFGLADKVRQINHKALRIARDVREICGRPTLIAGAVGPLGALLEPYGSVSVAQAEEIFGEQIAVLLEQGVDLLLLETFSSLDEISAAIRVARRIGDLPIVAQMSFAEDGRTTLGHTPEEVATTLSKLGVSAVGVNCSVGAHRVYRVLAEMRRVAPDLLLTAQPNAGWPTERNNRIFYPSTPSYMARYASRMVRELGVALVGGCCGTTPDHIAAMRTTLDELSSANGAATLEVRDIEQPALEKAVKPAAEDTQLARRLANGEFVISVEIDPPKGHNPLKCLEGARMLREAGAHVINVADSPMARVRMSALSLCTLIQQQTGLETILHFTTRDRSLMGLQSDLLGAHALNVRNILALKGDPPALANYPGTSGVFDVDTIGLIHVIKGMNEGRDTAHNPIGAPTNFLIGAALNINAEDPDWEIERLHKKVAAGATFAMTQIAYDVEQWLRFREKLGTPPIPVILGILPLQSHRQAEFLKNEVPGISPTDEALERMRLAGANGRAEGVKMAQELMLAARETIDGVYIMPSFGRYEIAAEVISVLL